MELMNVHEEKNVRNEIHLKVISFGFFELIPYNGNRPKICAMIIAKR